MTWTTTRRLGDAQRVPEADRGPVLRTRQPPPQTPATRLASEQRDSGDQVDLRHRASLRREAPISAPLMRKSTM